MLSGMAKHGALAGHLEQEEVDRGEPEVDLWEGANRGPLITTTQNTEAADTSPAITRVTLNTGGTANLAVSRNINMIVLVINFLFNKLNLMKSNRCMYILYIHILV